MGQHSLSFRVDGIPRSQGSKKFLGTTDKGKIRMAESARGLPAWRSDIRNEAAKALDAARYDTDDDLARFWSGPIIVQIAFGFSRPASHYGTGRNSTTLKPSAPAFPASKNRDDVDKLARAVLDALSGVVFEDDGRVVHLSVSKLYDDRPGALIYIAEATK